MKQISMAVAAAVLLSLAGCKTWTQVGTHAVSISAPTRVNVNGEFYFTLFAKDKDGKPATAAFQWSVQWVGLEGGTHKGKSGVSEKIRVKGGKGPATLLILGYDAQDNWGEIAKHSFEVE